MTMEHINRSYLRRIHIWGKFVGFLTMLAGVVQLYQSVTSTLLTFIPGIITFYLGYLIYATGDKAKRLNLHRYRMHQVDDLQIFLQSYGRYLMISCILAVVILTFHIIWTYFL